MGKAASSQNFIKLLIFLVIFMLGVGVGHAFFAGGQNKQVLAQNQQNPYTDFLLEVYDKIKQNYWDNITDIQLLDLFRLASAKFLASDISNNTKKDDFFKFVTVQLKNKDGKEKKDAVVNIASAVLASLNPVGRSSLYTQKLEQQLKNTVDNVNPDKDLYKDLNLPKGASSSAVEQNFKSQADQLKKENTPEAKQKLQQIAYAHNVLINQDKKQTYDQTGVEPTIFTRLITPDIAYVQFKKFSPTSLDEMQKALSLYDQAQGSEFLIFDLRGNIGGAIDALPYFLGDFLGKNQYGFDFYHQGEYTPFKTVLDKLPVIDKFKEIIILIDNQTQSSAEVMAASLKKYNRGILVGTPTKGWGTVERVFPLDHQIDQTEKYSVFLVHSITLREDNLPIEGRGVDPNIDTRKESWENNLQSLVRDLPLVNAVKLVLTTNPQ